MEVLQFANITEFVIRREQKTRHGHSY